MGAGSGLDRREADLAAGRIAFREGGDGKPVVFVHGYLVDGRLWDGVAQRLADRFRCIVPDWPLGCQRTAMKPDADLSPPGLAAIIADFLTALELDDVTLVANDTGGALSQILISRDPSRIGRLVLTNCDCYENFPPGPFKALPPVARLPGSMAVLSLPFRVGPIARGAYRQLANAEIPSDLVASWLEPSLRDADVRRDVKKVTAGLDKRHTLEAAKRLRSFDGPTLLAWAPGDRYFPISYAKRLQADLAAARIVEVPGAKTFVPWDQPERVAELIAEHASAETG